MYSSTDSTSSQESYGHSEETDQQLVYFRTSADLREVEVKKDEIRGENSEYGSEEASSSRVVVENNVVHDYSWVYEGAHRVSSQPSPSLNALNQCASDIGDKDDQCWVI